MARKAFVEIEKNKRGSYDVWDYLEGDLIKSGFGSEQEAVSWAVASRYRVPGNLLEKYGFEQ